MRCCSEIRSKKKKKLCPVLWASHLAKSCRNSSIMAKAHPHTTVGLGRGQFCSGGTWTKCVLDFFAPQRVRSLTLNMRPFKAAWDCSALKSLPSLFSPPCILNTCIGGRLFVLGTRPGGGREKSHQAAVTVFHSSRSRGFLSPLTPDMCGAADSPHVLHRHVSVLALCACPPICSWGS